MVRINPPNTPFGLADLEAVVWWRGYRASAETDSKNDVLSWKRRSNGSNVECGREVGSTRLMAAIESSERRVNAVDIATSSSAWWQLRWRHLIT